MPSIPVLRAEDVPHDHTWRLRKALRVWRGHDEVGQWGGVPRRKKRPCKHGHEARGGRMEEAVRGAIWHCMEVLYGLGREAG
eukprot:362562-Chlamydomonas_euryale.AAC.5